MFPAKFIHPQRGLDHLRRTEFTSTFCITAQNAMQRWFFSNCRLGTAEGLIPLAGSTRQCTDLITVVFGALCSFYLRWWVWNVLTLVPQFSEELECAPLITVRIGPKHQLAFVCICPGSLRVLSGKGTGRWSVWSFRCSRSCDQKFQLMFVHTCLLFLWIFEFSWVCAPFMFICPGSQPGPGLFDPLCFVLARRAFQVTGDRQRKAGQKAKTENQVARECSHQNVYLQRRERRLLPRKAKRCGNEWFWPLVHRLSVMFSDCTRLEQRHRSIGLCCVCLVGWVLQNKWPDLFENTNPAQEHSKCTATCWCLRKIKVHQSCALRLSGTRTWTPQPPSTTKKVGAPICKHFWPERWCWSALGTLFWKQKVFNRAKNSRLLFVCWNSPPLSKLKVFKISAVCKKNCGAPPWYRSTHPRNKIGIPQAWKILSGLSTPKRKRRYTFAVTCCFDTRDLGNSSLFLAQFAKEVRVAGPARVWVLLSVKFWQRTVVCVQPKRLARHCCERTRCIVRSICRQQNLVVR